MMAKLLALSTLLMVPLAAIAAEPLRSPWDGKDVKLTDASLKVLAGMRNLHYVDLYHTLLSEQGFEGLKKALPECKINWNKDSTRRERRT